MSKCECRDCIHYEVCEYKGDMLCDYFKDKSLFVELPCKVGDLVFWIDWENREIKSNLLFEINFDGEHMWFEVGARFSLGVDEIFLTKEEAERKLREVGE